MNSNSTKNIDASSPEPKPARRFSSIPKPLSQFVPDILRAIPGFDAGFTQLVQHWDAIIGEPLCFFTAPETVTKGKHKDDGAILHLRVTGAAALEIQHQSPQILERINTHFGYRWICGLRLLQGTVKPRYSITPAALFPKADPPADLPETIAAIADENLQKALCDLGQAVWQAKKP